MAYTPPAYNGIDFVLTAGYTKPDFDDIAFVLGAGPEAVEIPTAEITLDADMDAPAVSSVANIPAAEITLDAGMDDPQILLTISIPTAEITLDANMDAPIGMFTASIPTAEITLVASLSAPVAAILAEIPTAEITLDANMGGVSLQVHIPTAEITMSGDMDNPFVSLLADIPTAEITMTARVGISETVGIPTAEITLDAGMGGVSLQVHIPTAGITMVASLSAPVLFLQELADVYYIFTLTGAADGVADIEVPMSSFQARMRNGNPTFLSVVLPDGAQAAAINARSNGTLLVDMAYKLGGVFIQRETIVSVDLEDIRVDEGQSSSPITLSGHKTETYPGNAVTLTTSIYRSTINGIIRHRLAEPNINLRPGDTVTIGSDTFVVELISYFISVASKTMEIAEEG